VSSFHSSTSSSLPSQLCHLINQEIAFEWTKRGSEKMLFLGYPTGIFKYPKWMQPMIMNMFNNNEFNDMIVWNLYDRNRSLVVLASFIRTYVFRGDCAVELMFMNYDRKMKLPIASAEKENPVVKLEMISRLDCGFTHVTNGFNRHQQHALNTIITRYIDLAIERHNFFDYKVAKQMDPESDNRSSSSASGCLESSLPSYRAFKNQELPTYLAFKKELSNLENHEDTATQKSDDQDDHKTVEPYKQISATCCSDVMSRRHSNSEENQEDSIRILAALLQFHQHHQSMFRQMSEPSSVKKQSSDHSYGSNFDLNMMSHFEMYE